MILNDGCCPVHTRMTAEQVHKAKDSHPDVLVLSHPECEGTVLALSDFIGSTAEIISFAKSSDASEFIVCTEVGVDCKLISDNPDKRFYFPSPCPCCTDMKRNTLERVLSVLINEEQVVEFSEDVRQRALLPLNKMLEFAK